MLLPHVRCLHSGQMAPREGAFAREREFLFYLARARGRIESYVRSHVRDMSLREEIVQEVMIRLYRFLPRLESPRSFGAWLHRMIRNQTATSLRAMSRRPEIPCDFVGEAAADSSGEAYGATRPLQAAFARAPESPLAAAARRELLADLARQLPALPERQRMAFRLFALEQRPIAEVARAMKCSAGAVKFHVHAARAKLREALRHHLER